MAKIKVHTKEKHTITFDEKQAPNYIPDPNFLVIKTSTMTFRFPWQNVLWMEICENNATDSLTMKFKF